MKLTSTAFQPGGSIPRQHTCEGDDVSPPLAWSDIPEGTKSFALIVDDPDAPDPAAPKRVFVHWVVVNLPASVGELPRGVADGELPDGVRQGRHDGGGSGYMGPCPPIGRHRYFFKLYALDSTLEPSGTLTKASVEAAMASHILASAELMGTYQKHA